MVKTTVRNVVAIAGAGSIFAGLWLWSLALALVVVGSLAVAGAVWGHVHDS